MWDVILEALTDSAKIFPVLFIAYLLIELLEEKIVNSYKTKKVLNNKFAPAISACFGLIPQCGFSVVATDLFSNKFLSLGSLFAVFIATSDEAIPILLSQPDRYADLGLIVGIKFAFAILVGMLVDLIFRPKLIEEVEPQFSCIDGCCGHKIEEQNEHRKSKLDHWLFHPLIHSLKIFAFILIVNLIFGIIIFYVTEDVFINFMMSTGFFQPFLVGLVGLIPNCASSVIITETFLFGGITLGSCLTGLCVNSGIALLVLFRLNKKTKQNVLITISLYMLCCVLGIIVNLF